MITDNFLVGCKGLTHSTVQVNGKINTHETLKLLSQLQEIATGTAKILTSSIQCVLMKLDNLLMLKARGLNLPRNQEEVQLREK